MIISIQDIILRFQKSEDLFDRKFACDLEESSNAGSISDGNHTFRELYHHRTLLFAVITNLFKDKSWKSKIQSDGNMPDGYFIAGIQTPEGQATYHVDLKYWDLFDCEELPVAPEYDGHTSADAIARIFSLRNQDDRQS